MSSFGVSSTESWFGVSETELESAGTILGSTVAVGTAATGSVAGTELAISGIEFAVSDLEFAVSGLEFVTYSKGLSVTNTEFVVFGTEFAIVESAAGGDCRFVSSGVDDGGNEASVSSDCDRILTGLYTYVCIYIYTQI